MNQDVVHPSSNSVHKSKLRPRPKSNFYKTTLFKTFIFCFLPFIISPILLTYLNNKNNSQSGKNSEMVLLAGFHNDPGFANVDSTENESVPYKGTILRTKNGYVSSTMGEPCFSCTTFNILAPIYKRLDQQNQSVRESDFRAFWIARNERIVDWLLYERSSIICLQEFWVGNEELVHMYEERLGAAGYDTLKLARTNNRGDGLLTAIHKEYFRVLHHKELLLNDFGDRVAQLLRIQSVIPFSKNGNDSFEQEILIVNTHLLFPHDSSLSIVRLHQVYQILQHLETYQKENKLSEMPVILCGDWNGSKRGHVYKFLRSQGFVSSYDIAHEYADNDADAHRWVSHRNHRGNICGVDFIWLRNPNKSRKPLKISWAEAAFGIIKYQLQKASMAENDAFAFLRADNNGNYISYSGFCDALRQVNLTGLSHGLSFQETKDLWVQADIDGDGVLDYEEFKVIKRKYERAHVTCMIIWEDQCCDYLIYNLCLEQK
ncbi:uncharacterized calcium-binding protein At1g02270-like isoform X2 [Durio zibethinus]|uniref:Uncharacterized calcium-binding protein At1g02270-like isoform X2 n=1 Tax=Durio zibethinus TaxID=66656 RepID=A0A6P5ZYQ8_DURZI|nr:uncharacterized calcium-binding protein At1g02270-like isoform X2 [Durio zibethinus]